MSFTDKQKTQLNRSPSAAHLRQAEQRGKTACCLDGWRAIEAANRIFGPDNWDRETVEMRCAATKTVGQTISAAYVAKVRITIRAGDRIVVREGQGCGDGRGESPFDAHDKGLKAAEIDATKRALATFGRAMGLGSYLGERPRTKRVSHETSSADKANDTESEPAVQDDATQAVVGHKRNDHSILGEVTVTERGDAPAPLSPDNPSPSAAMLLPKERRIRDKDHLRLVAAEACLICGRKPCDAHHLRFAQPRAMASKVSDEFTIPLCRIHHQQLHHDPDERAWWQAQGIEPLGIAEQLWKERLERIGGQ